MLCELHICTHLHTSLSLTTQLASFPGPLLERSLHVTFDPRGLAEGLVAYVTSQGKGEHTHVTSQGNKGDFRDALCLRYKWPLKFISSTCICGQQQSLEHALSCSRGGFPTLRHNEIRDITASYLSEIHSNVTVEPHLQPLTGESLCLSTSNQDDAARVDIAADGFWTNSSRAFFDVRVFNPHAQSNASLSPTAAYCRHEREKSCAYEQRICEIEHGSFPP